MGFYHIYNLFRVPDVTHRLTPCENQIILIPCTKCQLWQRDFWTVRNVNYLPICLTMFLYNITLQPPASINCAVVGHFSGTKQQEIVISRVTRLELWRVDPTTRKLQTLLTQDVFGIIRSLTPFRLTGGSKGMR